MTDAWGSLLVEVWDDEIVITLPASIYAVTYYRPANSAGLLARISRSRMTIAFQ